jgi:acyl dehydratase
MTNSDWIERIDRAADAAPPDPFSSPWFEITQNAVSMFAQSVHDPDPVHLDPEWTRAHTPFPGTIAQGLWGASMLVAMLHQTGYVETVQRALGVEWGLNYGYDKLRLIAPMPVGARIRGQFRVLALTARGDAQALLRLGATIEIEHEQRPALSAEWLLAFLRPAPDER